MTDGNFVRSMERVAAEQTANDSVAPIPDSVAVAVGARAGTGTLAPFIVVTPAAGAGAAAFVLRGAE